MTAQNVIFQMEKRHALFGLFFAFHNRLQAAGDSFYEEITCKQFFLLACMNLYPDEAPTASELAGIMGCSRQNVKEILSSLERKGFIRILKDEKDRRKQRIYLTEKMQQMADKYHEKEVAFMERLYEGVEEEEIEQTYRILAHMENNLKKIQGDGV